MEVKELAGNVHVKTLRDISKRFGALYFKPVKSDYSGLNRDGNSIPVDSVGKLLFGVPGGFTGYVSAKSVNGKTLVTLWDHEANSDLDRLFALTIQEALKPGGLAMTTQPMPQRRREERRPPPRKEFKRREEARPPQQAPQEIEAPLSAEELQKLATEVTGIFEQAVKES